MDKSSNRWMMCHCDIAFDVQMHVNVTYTSWSCDFALYPGYLIDDHQFLMIRQRDIIFDLKINIGYSSLYFRVQCLISGILFDG